MRQFVAPIAAVFAVIVLAAAAARADDISIVVSPSTINLRWKGQCVTVHAEIPFSQVAPDSVTLSTSSETINATGTFADDRGDLVAKFSVDDVKGIVESFVETGMVTLTLDGTTKDGDPFAGSDTVRVIDVGAKN